jgi:nitroimidazol reductase NimA-like FMN-containing flavoprotein (pyridoxamine 5'-phosphate oxidase superfamily)
MDQTDHADGRTGLVALTQGECWDRLRATEVGRVAVTVGTTPDIFPVTYRIHRNEVVIRTEAGTKLAAATLMASVAFEIDSFDVASRTGWSVVVKGHGREPTRLDEVVDLDELGMEPWVDAPKTRWLLITPREVTGRRTP